MKVAVNHIAKYSKMYLLLSSLLLMCARFAMADERVHFNAQAPGLGFSVLVPSGWTSHNNLSLFDGPDETAVLKKTDRSEIDIGVFTSAPESLLESIKKSQEINYAKYPERCKFIDIEGWRGVIIESTPKRPPGSRMRTIVHATLVKGNSVLSFNATYPVIIGVIQLRATEHTLRSIQVDTSPAPILHHP